MTSIKGVKGFVSLLENTYNTPVQWLIHVVNIKKNNIIVKSVIEI